MKATLKLTQIRLLLLLLLELFFIGPVAVSDPPGGNRVEVAGRRKARKTDCGCR